MRLGLALALALVPSLVPSLMAPAVAQGVRARQGADGIVEFTNAAPAGKKAAAAGGKETIWAREGADGVVTFTNLAPEGKSAGPGWKVLYKTGPGKASAERGKTDAVQARDASPSRFTRYDAHIRDQEAFYAIPQTLIRAIIKTESDYDPHVVSSAGARGLMQLMPYTARMMGVTDVFDPRQNIMGGARYLQILAQHFCKGSLCTDDDLVKVIAGYHAGPGAVDKYKGLPPYETTRAYVANVLERYRSYGRGLVAVR